MMNRKVLWMSLTVAAFLVVAVTAGVTAADSTHSSVANKQVRVTSLSKNLEKLLRKAGVVGPALNLVGKPIAGVSLYRAPWAQGGVCISNVDAAGVPDGADCSSTMFTADEPGYASAGRLAYTLTGKGSKSGTVIVPPHTLAIQQVYGVATSAVKAARLVGPRSGNTELPIHAGAPGFVVFGSSDPPADGNIVELLGAGGTTLQKIQIAP